jgi:hypothetical protein
VRSFPQVSSIKTFDFATLYTTLPHDKLKTRLKETIHKFFSHRNYGSKFVVLGYNSTYLQAFEETPTHMSIKKYRLEEGHNSYPLVCRRPALGYNSTYFSNKVQKSKTCYSEEQVISMLEFLIDNIFVFFGGILFQQVVGIPMGTNCAPLLAYKSKNDADEAVSVVSLTSSSGGYINGREEILQI